ncbi:MAG: protein kinase [Sandaracinaceae bacterium]
MSYRAVRPLAKGGMGTVSLVVKQEGTFRRAYALKRLLPQLRSDPEVRAMFLREAEIAGLLHHPNVVSVVDFGEDVEGPFLVMDYVHGVSLHQLLKAMSAAGSRLSTLAVAQIFEPVARGLEAAHELTDHAGGKRSDWCIVMCLLRTSWWATTAAVA